MLKHGHLYSDPKFALTKTTVKNSPELTTQIDHVKDLHINLNIFRPAIQTNPRVLEDLPTWIRPVIFCGQVNVR
jgi:hypothetical protein